MTVGDVAGHLLAVLVMCFFNDQVFYPLYWMLAGASQATPAGAG